MNPRVAEEAAAFGLALGFLTRLPLGGGHTPARMAAATAYLAPAGVLIGLFAAAVFLAADRLFPPVVALLLATAATCLLTGALHEDGLADTADGLGSGATPERALEIMRDSHIGAFGALALGLTLALRIAALAAMPAPAAAAALVAAHGAGRASAVLVIAGSRYARPAGTGGFTAGGVRRSGVAVTLVTAGLCLALAGAVAGWGAAAGAALGLALAHAASRLACERRLGGYTGDTLGATEQLSETGLVLGMLAWL